MRTPPKPPEEPHYAITSSETGRTEYRKLLTWDEVRFEISLALMDCGVFHGTLKKSREDARQRIAEDIVYRLQRSGAKVFERFARNFPMPNPGGPGGRKHLWKTDEEVAAEERHYAELNRKRDEKRSGS